ncbi:MAG: 50S ribosomal protein L32 [Oscillospiraceae bacterium]|jgi:large subunit ribosomal protein L32|nr:50S ribosomal protein L32 [Oscillospiraceae bacterium]
MAVPKNKTSKQRKAMRRSSVWRLDTPSLSACPKCGELYRPHRVCKACGFYNGRDVLQLEAASKKKK